MEAFGWFFAAPDSNTDEEWRWVAIWDCHKDHSDKRLQIDSLASSQQYGHIGAILHPAPGQEIVDKLRIDPRVLSAIPRREGGDTWCEVWFKKEINTIAKGEAILYACEVQITTRDEDNPTSSLVAFFKEVKIRYNRNNGFFNSL